MRDGVRRALLERLIDHAALFPPASMSMEEALAEDRAARAGSYSWMLDRFVCPASRLGELDGLDAPVSVVLDGELESPDVHSTRETLFKGFGSCSWREPIDDLRALGVLE